MGMVKRKIGDILTLQRGYDLPASKMEGGNVAVVGSNGIIGYHNIVKYDAPCIIVGRSGSVGKVRYYSIPTWPHNTALFVKDFKGNDPLYLYYFLKNLHLDEKFSKSSSVVPSLDRNIVHSLHVQFQEDINEQKNIAKILSAFDIKIALNRQINDNLEAMAKQLYDYWFVQFDFPDENGKPYKSNGGKMVWNECMKKSIPADWKTSLLSEWIDYSLERVSTSVVSDGDFYTPIEVIPRNKMSLSTTLPVENAVSGLCRYKKKDILLSNRRVYFHKICLAPFDGLTRDTVMVLRPKHEENLGYIYETMFSDSFISYATKVSYGSLQPVLSWTEAQKYHVLTPAKNLSEKYGKLINGIIEKVLSSQMEIIQLTKQRDELLPLLMNGQATVNYHLSIRIKLLELLAYSYFFLTLQS